MEDEGNPFSLKPTDKQKQFVTTTSQYSCMSGGFGSGKTVAGCMRALLLSSYPKNRGVIGRLTYPELVHTTQKSFFEICPPEYYDPKQGGQWKPSERYLRLINGSEILFFHLDNVSEKELLSLNIGWFYIDQAEEISERVFQILQSRLRLNTVPNRYGFITCNPEPGNWIYKRFKEPYEKGTPTKNFFLVDTASYDNPYLPPDYIKQLLASYPDAMAKRYIEGRWDAFEGQIYPEFDTQIHVIKSFDVPTGWEKIVALDHGMTNPTGILLGAVDFDGNLFIMDEYYNPGIVSEHARGLHEMTAGMEITMWLIDPSTRAKTMEKNGMPWSTLQEYEDQGFYFIPANNAKLAGINRVKEFLRVSDKRINPRTGKRGSPRVFVFSNCVNLITELQQYQWKKLRASAMRNLPEEPRDYMDHLADALRYMIMSRFPASLPHDKGDSLIPRNTPRNNITETLPKGYRGDNELGQFYGDNVDNSLVSDDFQIDE